MPSVAGVSLATATANLRYKDRDDVLLVEFVASTKTAAVFTQSAFAAAPVIIAKDHLKAAETRALLVNMGNANAATGAQGLNNCQACCQVLAENLGLPAQSILPFSTGVIGEQIDVASMQSAIELVASRSNQSDWPTAAHAIMTTDTVAKAASRQIELDGELITINGIAKGSGMICPNMATMLGFVATDAPISKTLLEGLLKRSVEASFNRITVDSDTSTNDAVTLSATGVASIAELVDSSDPRVAQFYVALEEVMVELATAIVRDGEGATKFINVKVNNGASEADARAVAYAVANSPLVKTALFASDPNWGRLPMAIGKADAKTLNADTISIAVNGVAILHLGTPHPDYTEAKGKLAFAESEITIEIDLGCGDEEFNVWTSDLSHDYVSINADYRS